MSNLEIIFLQIYWQSIFNFFPNYRKRKFFVDYHDIYDLVLEDEKWKKIGEASDQNVLTDAQTLANEGLPVIAINTSDEHKFSVLVTKGETQQSRSWNLKTPNTAAFFPVSNPKSYTNKPLSYSWSSPKGIILYVRK